MSPSYPRCPMLLTLVLSLVACGGGEKGGGGPVVEPPPATPALVVGHLPTNTLRPGADLAIDGSGFTQTGMSVTIAGLDAPIASVSATRVVARVPDRAQLPCTAPIEARVVVRRVTQAQADSVVGQIPLDPAAVRALAVGERVVVTDDSAALRCTRLDAGGQYVVALVNTSTAAPGGVAMQLRGRAVGVVIADRAGARAPVVSARPSALFASEHAAHLARERERLTALGSPLPALARERSARSGRPAAVATPAVGDVLTLSAMYFDCAAPTAVRARVVAVGARSVVLEDVASAGAGTRDALYKDLADEFDRVSYPIVTQYFGDPLALDARLGGDGRVRILFTPYVSDSVPNTVGFMTGCNFFARAQLSSSNEAAVFYARLPNGLETTVEWRRQLRATLVHETKHLAAYAERFARAGAGQPVLEETWLEESTARVAEELYARTFSGAAWKGNAPYAPTVGCEVTFCDARPVAMFKHFAAVYDFYTRVDSLTPLAPVSRFDQTFYGSGWLLVRWAADQFAPDEPTFFRALTTETSVTGIANLAKRTARAPDAMLADWALALAVDDRPGFTPRDATLTIPSWNTRDVFAGLARYNPFQFPRPFPLLERAQSFGDFTIDVPLVRSYSAAFVELSGAAGARQLLSLGAAGGGAPPPNVAFAIVRVQ